MKWIYYKTSNNKYRFALGEINDNPSRVLFCFGINPSTAEPNKLDPTLKRVRAIAQSNNYDSWIMLNVCPERATDPNAMAQIQNIKHYNKNLKIIRNLLHKYRNCSDVLFAYGDLISKRDYLQKNLCEIINIIKTNQYVGKCYCLGKTKLGNAKHPLYQKANTTFALYSLDGHKYSKIEYLTDNKCVIRDFSENGELLMETFGTYNSKH